MSKLASTNTLLQKSIAATFTTIAYLRSVNGPDPETQFMDVTDLTSTHLEDGEPTGQSAPGSVTAEGLYDPDNATQQSVISEITDPGTNGKASYKVVYPDSSETTFTGTCRKFSAKASVGDALLADYEWKLSGMATFPS